MADEAKALVKRRLMSFELRKLLSCDQIELEQVPESPTLLVG